MAIFFAYIAQVKRLRFCLKISFLIIFLFLALRYNYGNDYMSYLNMFFDINQRGFESFRDLWMNTFLFNIISPDNEELKFVFANSSNVELGWQALCLMFKPFGFFAMIAFLALFNCVVYYFFIKKYVPPAYYWLAVFLYVFSPSLMLTHSSAMRQSVAIALFLIAINYIYEKKFLRYTLLISLATLFHASAIILLPIYLLGVLRFKTSTPIAIGAFLLFLVLFLLKDPLLQAMGVFVSTYASKYEVYQEASAIGSGLGVILSSTFLILILLYDKYQNKEISLQFKIAILSFFLIPLSLVVMMIGRLSLYFLPPLITVYPMVLLKMDNYLFKYSFMVIIVLWTLYGLLVFFQSDIYRIPFGTYDTIFSSL